MSTTATYAVTMADVKAEPAHGSLWSSYGNPLHLSGRFNQMDSTYSTPSSLPPLSGRPRSSHPGMEHPPFQYGRYSQDDADAYEKHSQPPLTAHQSYPNLKRPYSQTDQPAYSEIVQDLRDDGSKLSVNHDHKLLSFKRVQDKHTIVDHHGRMQQLELSAQLHGMFFLSELPSGSTEAALQPELTCYRRNLFQVSGSLITPRGSLSIVNETGETVPVSSTEVTISAIESVDNHPVRLIVIPWKTPPPNSPDISQTPDQEPPALPLIPFQDDGSESDGEFAVYPIGWRRLQFRIATANNGRRKELQQHFILHLKVVGTLGNGEKVVLAETRTSPIVVRGRSPRNFQARKEIPLLGSSAGSRGQALVETGLGIVAGPLTIKPQEGKARPAQMEAPRGAFTFSAPKMPTSQMAPRSNSYPNSWNVATSVPVPPIPSSAAPYPTSTGVSIESYPKMPLSGASNFTAEPQELPLQQSSMPSVPLSLSNIDQHQHHQQQEQQQQQQHHQQHQQQQQQHQQHQHHHQQQQHQQQSAPPSVHQTQSIPQLPQPQQAQQHRSPHERQGPIQLRTPYGYAGGSSGPPPLSISTAAPDSPLSVPRYVDSNPRPLKSPRNLGHHSVHSIGSLNESVSGEYRYGASSYVGVNNNTADLSPHAHQSANYASAVHAQEAPNASNPATQNTAQPARDYFPPAPAWTTTAGETIPAVSYPQTDAGPYAYHDQYKPGHGGSRPDAHLPPPPVPSSAVYPNARGSFGAIHQYPWSAA